MPARQRQCVGQRRGRMLVRSLNLNFLLQLFELGREHYPHLFSDAPRIVVVVGVLQHLNQGGSVRPLKLAASFFPRTFVAQGHAAEPALHLNMRPLLWQDDDGPDLQAARRLPRRIGGRHLAPPRLPLAIHCPPNHPSLGIQRDALREPALHFHRIGNAAALASGLDHLRVRLGQPLHQLKHHIALIARALQERVHPLRLHLGELFLYAPQRLLPVQHALHLFQHLLRVGDRVPHLIEPCGRQLLKHGAEKLCRTGVEGAAGILALGRDAAPAVGCRREGGEAPQHAVHFLLEEGRRVHQPHNLFARLAHRVQLTVGPRNRFKGLE
mmetsp:Transcript_22099/g.55722  ORF Transcript_22099/g.55722 Transcript_22099/m.55722 type:complete len:326 (-) Transcript_22099:1889-2866(-)